MSTLLWSSIVLWGVYMRPLLLNQATGVGISYAWSWFQTPTRKKYTELDILEKQQRLIDMMETQMVHLIREVRSLKKNKYGGAPAESLSESVYLLTDEEGRSSAAPETEEDDIGYIIIG